MSESVFNSYINSVYGSGSGLDFFDSIQGGYEDLDIFGGVSPAEILDEIDNFYPKKHKDDPKHESKSIANDTTLTSDDIIGYIQIGIHTMPIVDNDTDIQSTTSDGGIVEPMSIQLCPQKKEKVGAKAIGEVLKRLTSS